MPTFFADRYSDHILYDNLLLFLSVFTCFLLLPQQISCDPKVRMIEPIGHSPAAADSNLVFRIRYGEHNNIIGLIIQRAAVPTVPYSLSKLVYFFTFALSKTIMIYYQIFVQANYGLGFRECAHELLRLFLTTQLVHTMRGTTRSIVSLEASYSVTQSIVDEMINCTFSNLQLY